MLNSGKRLIVTVIAVSLAGIVAGFLLESRLIPLHGSNEQNAEKTLSNKTETIVVEHTHDDLPMHKHIIQATITTTETTPHGDIHDFNPLMAFDMTPIQTPIVPQTTANGTQNTSVTQNTTMTKVYDVFVYFNDIIPKSITVPVGATITWTNLDNQEHTVSFDNLDFNGRLVARGTTGSHTFIEPGTFAYHCTLHPSSTGEVGEVIVK